MKYRNRILENYDKPFMKFRRARPKLTLDLEDGMSECVGWRRTNNHRVSVCARKQEQHLYNKMLYNFDL